MVKNTFRSFRPLKPQHSKSPGQLLNSQPESLRPMAPEEVRGAQTKSQTVTGFGDDAASMRLESIGPGY